MQVSDAVKYAKLLDVYGNLLTSKQCLILTDYLCYDNTLTEIAQSHKTTRQAVKDIISRSLSRLDELEQKLQFCKKLNSIQSGLTDLQKKYDIDDLKQKIAKIIQTLEA